MERNIAYLSGGLRLPLAGVLWMLVLGLVAGHHASAQEPVDPHRPPAIKTQSVPVVPQEIFDKLERYESVRSAGFAGWAPDGSGMLVRTRFGNSLQLHRVYEPGGRREQITFFEEPVSGGFLQNAKDNAILLSMSRGGNENYQVHWLDQANFRTVLLTDGKSRYSIGPANADATRIVLSSNERNGRDTDLYIADPRKPDARELVFATDRQFWTAADWSQDGKTLLLARYVSANESHPALFDVAAKRLTELPLPTDAPAAISAMAFSPDGKYAYVATDAGSEFRQLALLDLGTKKYTWLTQDIPWDISDLAVDEKSGAVAAVTNENGLGRLYLFEGRSPIELKRRAVALPAGIISGLEFSPDGKSLGMTLAASNAPAEAYSLDLASGQTTRWTFSEVGGLDPSKFVSPEQVRFKSFDGREVPAYYYRVKDASPARKAPVLINIHGGPESQFRPFFSGATQFYVHELGIAVIAPNVRGSSGYGKTYLKLDNAEKREDSVKDIGALLDWIAQQPELDASRVAVAGGSYGGYMTLASLVHYGERLKAGIDVVGIANYITFLENTAAYRQDLRRAEYGDERDPVMRKKLEEISPLNKADRIRSALLVIHGVNDPRVPFGEARQIADKVRQKGKPVWTVFADNEGHGFAKKDNSDYARGVQALFLREHLK